MLDQGLLHKAEWDRSFNKSYAIPYDKTSMPVQNAQFERMLNLLFEQTDMANMVSSTLSAKRKTESKTLEKCLKSIVWHLYRAFIVDQDCYVQIRVRTH